MIVIGLTGSIGMGKSTIARQCAMLGARTISADALVHALMQPGGAAFSAIAREFPEAVVDGKIDRKTLGAIVFPDASKLRRLEEILHPLVRTAEEQFAARMKRMGVKLIVMDIPLLFETGGERRMDMTMTVTAPGVVQAQRVLARPGMTREKFAEILARQLPDREKRKRADIIVHTGLGKAASMRQIALLFSMLGVK